MTGVAVLLVALALAAACADWVAVQHGAVAARFVTKPAPIVVLIGAALAIDVDDEAVQVAFVAALVLSLLGDVLLLLPERFFVYGLGGIVLPFLGIKVIDLLIHGIPGIG